MAKTIGGKEWVKSGEIAPGKQARGVMLWSFTPWSSSGIRWEVPPKSPFHPIAAQRVSWMTKARRALVVRLWVEKPEAVKLSTWNSKVMGAIRQEFPPSLPIHTSVSPTAWEREEVRIRGRKIWIYAWAEGPEVSAGYGVGSYSVVLPRWWENLAVAPTWGQWEMAAWDIPLSQPILWQTVAGLYRHKLWL